MKRAFVAAALVGMLVAVAACGGSSPTVASNPTDASSPASASIPASGLAATSADRDKFVGTWTGKYGCDANTTIDDKMVIKAGSGNLDLSITVHSNASNPDTVTGTLTSPTMVDVPAQSMGGMTSTAKLKLTGGTLEFRATAMGLTCGGTAYSRAP
jgi:hypothetical protein